MKRRAQFILVAVALAAYAVSVAADARRRIWYDELFTYYVASAPSWKDFWSGILHVDLNPPLMHLLVRLSLAVLGDSAWAVRLPSMLLYLAASGLIYVAVRRRADAGLALLSVSIWWSGSFFLYATEARPYAALLFGFALAGVCWQRAAAGGRRRWALVGLSAGFLIMMASHCFGPLSMIPFGIAELSRWYWRRRPDWGLWAAMAAPLPFALLYLPLVRNFERALTCPAFAESWPGVVTRTVAVFYELLPAAGVCLAAALAVHWWSRRWSGTQIPRVLLHERVFVLSLAVIPFAVKTAVRDGAYWQRYAIALSPGAAVLLTVLLFARFNQAARIAACIVALGVLGFRITDRGPETTLVRQGPNTELAGLAPELPIVDASGLTFLEMTYYERPELLSRVYYLTDREAAVRYAGTTLFEGLPVVMNWRRLNGNVESYHSFVERHPRFLVLETPGYPEDWLIPKLKDDGARLRDAGTVETGYRDRHFVEVEMRSRTRTTTRP